MVSVILPAYNGEKFIRETIDSVLGQTYKDLELIVIDDGSTDKTAEIVNSISDPRVRSFYQNNAGVAAARNKGFEVARGEYVASIDQDDLWASDKLEKQLVLFNNPEVGVVYSRSYQIGINGEKLLGQKECRLYKGSIFKELLVNNFITSASVVIRTGILKDNKLSFKNGRHGADDWDLWLRLSRLTQFDFVDSPLVKIRIHGGNFSLKGESMYESSVLTINDTMGDIINDRSIEQGEKRKIVRLLGKGYFLQTLFFGHWLLANKRKKEARAAFFKIMIKHPFSIRPLWGIIKSYIRR